jgi:hypothetical protein
MTCEQLEALAEYRKHKYCQCRHCQAAREILREMDARHALGRQGATGPSPPAVTGGMRCHP